MQEFGPDKRPFSNIISPNDNRFPKDQILMNSLYAWGVIIVLYLISITDMEEVGLEGLVSQSFTYCGFVAVDDL